MKILFIIGTRPEAIKMAPLISKFIKSNKFEVKLCNTGQHKELVSQVFDFFKLKVDYNLNIMTENQGLNSISSLILKEIDWVFLNFNPDYVLVHGDTTTSFVASLAAFYSKIKVAHVEAGLRTFNKYSPFPEEMNRTLTSKIANVHFAPTITAKNNLILEGVKEEIIVTGNTVIDALQDSLSLIDEEIQEIIELKRTINGNKKIVLITGHRRENFGTGFESAFNCLNEILKERDDIILVYPVHPNPNVKIMAELYFGKNNNVKLITPLSYSAFIWIMKKSYVILTDSGGIQEEAPSLGKPVLVLRDSTERPEAVEAGTVILVGTNKDLIKNNLLRLLDDVEFYNNMTSIKNPYGDGKASERIVNYFENQIIK